MPDASDTAADPFQARFERTWGHLTRPHVRALAWLLDAPDLLDPASPHWDGRIATLGPMPAETAAMLAELERDPAPLDAALGGKFYSRLGLYAEKLMAFHFEQRGILAAHGLQVRANRNDTVGEFDFLLRDGARLLHWEFATKFYLLEGEPGMGSFNGLIGPNLADTLGLKMRKILAKQLELARHPAAQPLLPQPVDLAQALVKGWLFYPPGAARGMAGISSGHCHGFWSTLDQLDELDERCDAARYVVMPRLLWLAPLKTRAAAAGAEAGLQALERQALRGSLRSRFQLAPAPVLVASVREVDGWLVECERGFVVPDDWRAQAAARRLAGLLPP